MKNGSSLEIPNNNTNLVQQNLYSVFRIVRPNVCAAAVLLYIKKTVPLIINFTKSHSTLKWEEQ